jgi:uncharacterized protein YhfF
MEKQFDKKEYWKVFLDTQEHPEDIDVRFYESFSFGRTQEMADRLARLVLDGIKTATAMLAWEYESMKKELPTVGSFSIVLDGSNKSVCVIETTEVKRILVGEIDEQFAHDYGEGDRTLLWWQKNAAKFYGTIAESLGKIPSKDMVLICERFRVVFR